MAVVHRARFKGDGRAFAILRENSPDLTFTEEGGEFWISGDSLQLVGERDTWRLQLEKFARRSNMLVALSDVHSGAIAPSGAVEVVDGDRREQVLLMETLINESVVFPPTIVLAAKGGGPIPRPLHTRAREFGAREPRFERASATLAGCGLDMVELYKVAEIILRAHRANDESIKKAQERLLSTLPLRRQDWQAMLRAARPTRHAEPHDMDGPVLTPLQVRTFLQHVLKLWLEREVPA